MEKQELITILVGVFIIILFASIYYSYLNPDDDWLFCKRNMPKYNNTGKKTDICFTEQWDRYCELRAPHLCKYPANNFYDV